MKISVMTDILEVNNRIAAANREVFDKHRNLVINLMSSPGAGKTTLLEPTAEALSGKLHLGVIAGDIETTRDAERLERYQLPVVQLTIKYGLSPRCQCDCFLPAAGHAVAGHVTLNIELV